MYKETMFYDCIKRFRSHCVLHHETRFQGTCCSQIRGNSILHPLISLCNDINLVLTQPRCQTTFPAIHDVLVYFRVKL